MSKEIHHIFPNGHGGWCIRRDGDNKAFVTTDTKIKAIKIGIEISRHKDALVVIHDQDRQVVRTGSTPMAIPFPFPFSDRDAAHADGEAEAGEPRPRKAAASAAPAAETYLTFDFGAQS